MRDPVASGEIKIIPGIPQKHISIGLITLEIGVSAAKFGLVTESLSGIVTRNQMQYRKTGRRRLGAGS